MIWCEVTRKLGVIPGRNETVSSSSTSEHPRTIRPKFMRGLRILGAPTGCHDVVYPILDMTNTSFSDFIHAARSSNFLLHFASATYEHFPLAPFTDREIGVHAAFPKRQHDDDQGQWCNQFA